MPTLPTSPSDRFLIAAHDAWRLATGKYASVRGMRAAVAAVLSIRPEICHRCGERIQNKEQP